MVVSTVDVDEARRQVGALKGMNVSERGKGEPENEGRER